MTVTVTVTLQCKGLCWLRSHDCTAGVLFPGLEKDKRGAEEETAAHLSAVHTAEGALGRSREGLEPSRAPALPCGEGAGQTGMYSRPGTPSCCPLRLCKAAPGNTEFPLSHGSCSDTPAPPAPALQGEGVWTDRVQRCVNDGQ